MDDRFKNGLLGHRVEGYLDRTGKGLIEGIWVGEVIIDGVHWDRIVTDDGHISLVDACGVILPVNEPPMPAETPKKILFDNGWSKYPHANLYYKPIVYGNIAMRDDGGWEYQTGIDFEKIPWDGIKPFGLWLSEDVEGNEPQKPAEPYSIETDMGRYRLFNEVLEPNGYANVVTDGCRITAQKYSYNVLINSEGVCLVNFGARVYRDLPSIPLNEWVKNPTIESLMPQKQD